MLSLESDQRPVQQTKPLFGSRVAKISVLMPAISIVLNSALQTHTREGKLLLGSIQLGLILVGFVLAAFVLCRIKKYSKKGVLSWAIAGAAINGLWIIGFIVSFLTLMPALKKVKKHIIEVNGYTQEQMVKMPEIIPGSTKIIDNTVGFRIEIPKGFESAPIEDSSLEVMDVIYEYRMMQADGSAIAVSIMGMKGIIAQEAIDREALESLRKTSPENTKVSVSLEQWGDYTLEVIKWEMYIQGQQTLTLVAQIPLAREAIQINVAGLPQNEQQCFGYLRDMLKSLKGKSNWSISSERPAVGFAPEVQPRRR